MFLNLIMLAGLVGVASPVLIHWLSRRPPRPVKWAAMRFLRSSVEKHQKRLRQEDLLLLLLRCLLIALLAIALARPVLSSIGGLGGSADVYLVIDDSMSMNHGTPTRLDRAREAAVEVVGKLSSSTRVAVLSLTDVSSSPLPKPIADHEAVVSAIRAMPASDRRGSMSRDLGEIVRRIPAESDADVLLLTDGQNNASEEVERWTDLDGLTDSPGAQAGVARGKRSLGVLLIESEDVSNAAILDVKPADGRVEMDRPTRFDVRVVHHGAEPLARLRVRLSVVEAGDEATERRADEAVIEQLSPGEVRTVGLMARLTREGPAVVRATIDEDRLSSDDTREAVVMVKRSSSVMIVDGDLQRDDGRGEAFFVARALRPSETSRRSFAVTTVSAQRLASSSFETMDAVILANVAKLEPVVARRLSAYVRGGGALIVFAGDRTDVGFFNGVMSDELKLLPARLGEPTGDATNERTALGASVVGLDHPIASVWKGGGDSPLAQLGVRRSHGLELIRSVKPDERAAKVGEAGEAGDGVEGDESAWAGRAIVRLATAGVLVADGDVGRGYVGLVGVDASTGWSDLPLRPGVFVPLLHRMLGAAADRRTALVNGMAGELLRWPAGVEMGGRVGGRSDDALGGELGGGLNGGLNGRDREESSAVSLGGTSAEFARGVMVRGGEIVSARAGAFRVKVGEESGVVAFASAEEESDLTPLDGPRRRVLEQVAKVKGVEGPGDASAILQTESNRWELSLPLLVGVLLVALLESVLSQRFSRSK